MSASPLRSSALGVPAFRRLWTAGLVSDAGDWLLFIALPLVVLQLSGSAFGTAVAFLLELLPAVALAPLAARLVDRLDRRALMIATNVAQAVCVLPLALVHTRNELPIVYAVIVLQAAFSTLFEPAKNAMLPDLVSADRLVSANALVGLGQNLGRLVGGPMGGVLLVLGGLPLVVICDAASYLASAGLIALIPRASRPQAEKDAPIPGGRLLRSLADGRFRGLFVLTGVASVAQGMFLVLFVLFVVRGLHGSDADVGLLRGVQAVGAIAAGLAIGMLARRASARLLTIASTLAFGMVSLVTWNLPLLTVALPPYVVLFILVGAPGVIMSTGLISLLQLGSESGERGSVFSAWGLVTAVGQGLGILMAGLLDAPLGITVLLNVQGGMYLLAGLLGVVLIPAATRAPE